MTEETKAPEIGLADIVMCVQIIDLCSQRGAFKGDELETIGGLRTKLSNFVGFNMPKEEEEEKEGE